MRVSVAITVPHQILLMDHCDKQASAFKSASLKPTYCCRVQEVTSSGQLEASVTIADEEDYAPIDIMGKTDMTFSSLSLLLTLRKILIAEPFQALIDY